MSNDDKDMNFLVLGVLLPVFIGTLSSLSMMIIFPYTPPVTEMGAAFGYALVFYGGMNYSILLMGGDDK